ERRRRMTASMISAATLRAVSPGAREGWARALIPPSDTDSAIQRESADDDLAGEGFADPGGADRQPQGPRVGPRPALPRPASPHGEEEPPARGGGAAEKPPPDAGAGADAPMLAASCRSAAIRFSVEGWVAN